MFLLSICQWLQSTDFGTGIRESTLLYPVILTTHLAILAVFGGMVLMSDMRLLGFALTNFPVSQVVGRLRIWKRVGVSLMICIGFLLFSAKAVEYYANPYFRIKIGLLILAGVHGLVFRGRVYDKTTEMDAMPNLPGDAKTAAWISLVLWTCIIVAGRMIGYYEVPGGI